MKLANKKEFVIPLFIFACVTAALLYGIYRQTQVDHSPAISATITDINKRPNLAEDGNYGITAQDSSGQIYIIGATGYMNTPMMPSENGEECVEVPPLKVGDRIQFKLHRSEYGDSSTYVICSKIGAGNYYIRVE